MFKIAQGVFFIRFIFAKYTDVNVHLECPMINKLSMDSCSTV